MLDASVIARPTGGATIKSATVVPPAGQVPEYCAVVGAIAPVDKNAPDINFQVSIRILWNLKSWHSGGGGVNGVIPAVVANPGRGGVFGINPPSAPPLLAEGYALYGSDSGHSAGRGGGHGAPPDPATVAASSAWIGNEEAWRNFAFE